MTTTSACSEHMAGLLESAGYAAAPAGSEHADVVVINTCAVRENAANKLYGNLGYLASVKRKRPDMQIAVGGCDQHFGQEGAIGGHGRAQLQRHVTSLRHAQQNSPISNSTARTASATACTATSASRLMRMQLWPMDTLPPSSVGVVIVGQQLLQLGGVPLGQLWAPVVQRRRVLEQHDPPTAGMLLGDERLHGVDGCIQRALA